MEARFRPFDQSDADYRDAVDIENRIFPDRHASIDELRHYDETKPSDYAYHRLMVEVEGAAAGVGVIMTPFWSFAPGKFHIYVMLLPQARGQGIGARLYAFLLEAYAKEPVTELSSFTLEDQPGGRRFLERRGFELVQRNPISQLELRTFEPGPFAARRKAVREAGIEIVPLTTLMMRFEDWDRRLYELKNRLMEDVPTPGPITRTPFEQWRTRTVTSPSFMPEAEIIAVDGERWVGSSSLRRRPGNPKLLSTGLTGVARSHRRRGVATAMKLAALEVAQASGAEHIETDNEENNPMYLLNLALGFQPRPALLLYQKSMAG